MPSHEETAKGIQAAASTFRPGPKLLERMREALRSRHLSAQTEQAYVMWIRRFIRFHNLRHPVEMGEIEINAFLSHLAVKQRVSASTQTQALSAILFLYRAVLGREIGALDHLIRARRPKRLPVVLTREEVRAVIRHLREDQWLMATLMYGAGLRLMECLRLRVKDVDFSANQIAVRDGKGAQDRLTMLPQSVKQPLIKHLSHIHQIHQRDLQDGYGRVFLPDALDRKYPNAVSEWGWQYVFPAPQSVRRPAKRSAGASSRA